jgi:hypothetical protein
MYEPPKKRWGCLQWVIAVAVALLLSSLFVPLFTVTAKIGRQSQGINNCKQIILGLNQYSYDNGLAYPDGEALSAGAVSANQVFRILFKQGILIDERIFGCPNSVFVPDGDIGVKPDFANALTPGECHWMLLKFQTGAASGDTPLLVENALTASWPPKWDVSDQAGNKRGRAWPGHRIIVGRNDGSVTVKKLSPDGTIDWRPNLNPATGNKRWIDLLSPGQIAKLSYWDIEEK